TAVAPASPWDPVSLRYWWSQPDESLEFARFIVLRDGRAAGFAQIEHARWELQPERYASLRAELWPADRTRDALSAAIGGVEERARADGARILRLTAGEDDDLRLDVILGRGYGEDRRHRRGELDLGADRGHALCLAQSPPAPMPRAGGT